MSQTSSTLNEDQVALLRQLRLDRRDEGSSSGRARWRLWSWGVGLTSALMIGAWTWHASVAAPATVHVVPVRARMPMSDGGAGTTVLDASGYIVARRTATVSAKAAGRLDRLSVVEGQHVAEGEIIAALDDSNAHVALAQAEAQHESARASVREVDVALANARRELARTEALASDGFVSSAQAEAGRRAVDSATAQRDTALRNEDVSLRAIDAARLTLADTVVRAPFSGVVTARNAEPGEIVSPISGAGLTRTGVATIVDMASLEAEVDVNESFIDRLAANQQAMLRLNAYPDHAIPAHVVAIVPSVDRSKGTVEVRIALDARDPRVLPNMSVRASFIGRRTAGAASSIQGLQVPAEAVDADGISGAVFVVRDGVLERRAVRLASAPAGGSVTLESGVAAGELVVVGDRAGLRDGAHVSVQN